MDGVCRGPRCVRVEPNWWRDVQFDGGSPLLRMLSRSGWVSIEDEMLMLRVLYMPLSIVCMSSELWYSPYVKCVIWVCSNSECPEGSGQVGVSNMDWVCVKAVNSSGDRVENACCHIARRGLSGVGFSGCVACGRGSVMLLYVEKCWGLGFGCWPPPRGLESCVIWGGGVE